MERQTAIVRGNDGTYRWAYEFNLYRNPTILLTIVKIFAIVIAALFALSLVMNMTNSWFWDDPLGETLETLKFGGILALVMLALSVVGYLVYAVMMGGKYCVMFEMNEQGVVHRQYDKQVEKAQVVSAINVLAGLATGNITQVGIGLNSAQSELSSDFSAVRSVRGNRALGVIKVNELLAKNQVYVDYYDYDFVFGYIRDHCPNAKIKG